MIHKHNKQLFRKPPKKQKTEKKSLLGSSAAVLWGLVKGVCFSVGALLLLMIVGAFLFVAFGKDKTVSKLPNEMIVHLNMNFPVTDEPEKPTLLDPFPIKRPDMKELLIRLDNVASDTRVKAMVVSLHGMPIGISHVQELRQAIKAIHDAGKKTYIIAPDFGTGGGGLGEYYFASAFDEIWLHPVGVVFMPGLSAESPYLGALLKKIGIEPQFFQRKEYKTAFESFTKEEMSPENRAMLLSVLSSIGNKIVADIAKDRNLTPIKVKSLIDKALLTASVAKREGLVDVTNYGDTLITQLISAYGSDIKRITLRDYISVMQKAEKHAKDKTDVAYVRITGTISLASNLDPLKSDPETLRSGSPEAEALYKAGDDENIRAVLVRVDSPGGTPSAAELLRRGIVYAKAKGKKVYVSMSTTAASGGYWAAVNADQIYALPATLTGSIGVVGGKVSVAELLKNVDVKWEAVRYGDNAGLWSFAQPFSAEQARQFNIMLDITYQNFIGRVAEGRSMDIAQVEKIAKGRVWTGAQAKTIELVDETGSLMDVLKVISKDLELATYKNIHLIDYPEPKAPLEALLEFLSQQAKLQQVMMKLETVFSDLKVSMGLIQGSEHRVLMDSHSIR